MARRSKLRHEATRLRGRVDCQARLVRQRIDGLVDQLRSLARSPAALPVAFVAGVLAERLHAPVVNRAARLLGSLETPGRVWRIASGLIGAAVR